MKVYERLVEADQAVGLAAVAALPTVAIPDLAQLADVPVSELRRVVRSARSASVQSEPPADASGDHPGTPAPPAAQPAALDAAEPAAEPRDLDAALSTTAAR